MNRTGRKFLVALGLLALAVGAARATTIVAVRTSKEIYLGADSKVTDTFGNAQAAQVCKIVPAGGVVFAYAGFARDNRTGFAVPEIARAALESAKRAPLAEKVETLAQTLAERLETQIPELKQHSFVTYREKIEGRVFLRVLVAGFEKGRPALFVRLFRYGQTADGRIGVIVASDDCGAACKGKNVTRFLGETDAIDGLPEETKDFWKPGYAAGVRRLVELQIAARDEYVGPPVDILRLTAKRAEWIQRKSVCDTQK